MKDLKTICNAAAKALAMDSSHIPAIESTLMPFFKYAELLGAGIPEGTELPHSPQPWREDKDGDVHDANNDLVCQVFDNPGEELAEGNTQLILKAPNMAKELADIRATLGVGAEMSTKEAVDMTLLGMRRQAAQKCLELEAKIETLSAFRVCGWCGEVFRKDEPASSKKHIQTCEKNPLVIALKIIRADSFAVITPKLTETHPMVAQVIENIRECSVEAIGPID